MDGDSALTDCWVDMDGDSALTDCWVDMDGDSASITVSVTIFSATVTLFIAEWIWVV